MYVALKHVRKGQINVLYTTMHEPAFMQSGSVPGTMELPPFSTGFKF